jgi:hypothetical protein
MTLAHSKQSHTKPREKPANRCYGTKLLKFWRSDCRRGELSDGRVKIVENGVDRRNIILLTFLHWVIDCRGKPEHRTDRNGVW